jgi:hypothetical protein
MSHANGLSLRTRLLLTLALLLALLALGDPLKPRVPVSQPAVPVSDELRLEWWSMPAPEPPSLEDTFPADWRAVRFVDPATDDSSGSGVRVTGPGGSLTLSALVGVAPMELEVTWTVKTRAEDRALRLTLADEDSQPVAASERSLDGPPRVETTSARWQVSQAGAYVVIGCVVPRMACVVARLVVS